MPGVSARRLRRLSAPVIAVALLTLLGCGGSNRPFAVKGQLLYDDGNPIAELEGFTVTFTSFELKKSSRGTIRADGSFALGTYAESDGAFPGEYKVIVAQPRVDAERRQFKKPVVELTYEDPELTDLTATVKPSNSENDFTFKLRRLKK